MDFNVILPLSRIEAMRKAGFWPDRILLDYLDAWASKTPEAIAIIDDGSQTGTQTVLTYGELARRSRALAAGLLRAGIRHGDVVSMQLPNSWRFIALHLACLRIGVVSNPVAMIFRGRELEYMAGLTEARLLVVPSSFRGFDHGDLAQSVRKKLPGLAHVGIFDGDALVIDGDTVSSTDGTMPKEEQRFGPNDVVEIVFTSGTTGEPKGVMHTSNTLMACMEAYCERLKISPDVRVLMGSPLGHQTGFLYGMMMPLILGGRTVLMDVWDPGRAVDLIEREGITFSMGSTPFLSDLAEVAETRRSAFATLRAFLAAGSPIPRALVRRATENLGAHILSAWGMTECGAATVGKPDDPPERAYDTDGCPLRGIEVRVVNETGEPLPAGREGRLQVRGCNNFVGYLKRPELYQTDADGWFETGDLATMDEEQYIRITGRTKDILIRGGENIPVVEIEGVLFQHPKVREIAIVGVPDARLGERACAVVVPRGDETVRLDELTAFLAEKSVSKNYFPERLLLIDEMPKTPSGKIQKFLIREKLKSQQAKSQDV